MTHTAHVAIAFRGVRQWSRLAAGLLLGSQLLIACRQSVPPLQPFPSLPASTVPSTLTTSDSLALIDIIVRTVLPSPRDTGVCVTAISTPLGGRLGGMFRRASGPAVAALSAPTDSAGYIGVTLLAVNAGDTSVAIIRIAGAPPPKYRAYFVNDLSYTFARTGPAEPQWKFVRRSLLAASDFVITNESARPPTCLNAVRR